MTAVIIIILNHVVSIDNNIRYNNANDHSNQHRKSIYLDDDGNGKNNHNFQNDV